jgi:hypothetical protein
MNKSICKLGIAALLVSCIGCSTTQTIGATHRVIRKGYGAARKGAAKGIAIVERAALANSDSLSAADKQALSNAKQALVDADKAIVKADKAITDAWPAIERALTPKF